MEDKKVYSVSMQHFLNKECRIIKTDFDDCFEEDNYWMVTKDMFNCLDRIDESNGSITKYDMTKYREFMELMGWASDRKKLTVTSKSDKSKSRESQEVECVRLKRIPILITQFMPKKEGTALSIWLAYMHYIESLLIQNKVTYNLFTNSRTIEDTLRPFQGMLFTLAQVAPKVQCKNGKDLKQLLVQMNLLELNFDEVIDYDGRYLNCTNKTVRVKASKLEELMNLVLQYKKDNGIEDSVPKAKRKAKKVKCIQTNQVFLSIKEAAAYAGTGSSSIWNYLKGNQLSAGKHPETNEKLTWEYVEE